MQEALQKKKIKVCLVTISLDKGGAERSCALLSQMLQKLGYSVFLVSLNDAIEYPYAGTLLNLGAHKKKSDSFIKRMNRFIKFRKFLVSNKIDIIIDHRTKNNYYKELFYSKYIYKNIKKIYVVHSSKTAQYLTQKPEKFIKHCLQQTYAVGVSKYISEKILKPKGITNSTCIYNPFLSSWQKNKTELPAVLKEKTYFLSYGRIDDTIKDFSFLIKAYKASKLFEQQIFLVILGDGDDKKMLQEKVLAMGLEDFVLFLPNTPTPFSIIKHAKAVTLTSKYEGFPMVLVESLSLGTPVIALDIISGPNEIIKDQINGLLIKKRDVSLFAQGLKTVVNNRVLYEKLKNNTLASIKHLDIIEISKQWDKLLQKWAP